MIRYRIKSLIFGLVGIGCSFFVGDVEAMEVPSSTGTERVDPFFLESLPTDMRGLAFLFMDLPTLLAAVKTSHYFNQYASLLPRKFVIHYLSDGAAKVDDLIIDQLSKVAMYIPREWMNTAFQLMKEPLSFTEALDSLLKQRTLLQQDKAHRLRKKILPHCSMEERAHGVVAIIGDVGVDNLIESAHIPLDRNILSLPVGVMLAAKSLYEYCADFYQFSSNLTKQDLVLFMGKLLEEDRSKLASVKELVDPQFDRFENMRLMGVIKKFICESSKYHYYFFLPRAESFEALAHMTVLQIRALAEGIEGTSSEKRGGYFTEGNLFQLSRECEPEIISQIFELEKEYFIREKNYYPELFEIVSQYPKSHHSLILTLKREYNAINLKYMEREFSSISVEQLQAYLQVSQSWADKKEQNLYTVSKNLSALSPEQIYKANRLLKSGGEDLIFQQISSILPDFNPVEIHWLEGLFDHWRGNDLINAIKEFHKLEPSRRDYLVNQKGDVLWRTCKSPAFALKIIKNAPNHCFSAYFQITCKVLCLVEGAPDKTRGDTFYTENNMMLNLKVISESVINEWCNSFLTHGDKLVNPSDFSRSRVDKLMKIFSFSMSPIQLKEWALWNQSTAQGVIFSVFGYSLD